MKATGHIKDVSLGLDGQLTLSLTLNEKGIVKKWFSELKKDKLLAVEIKYFHKKRSLDANALLWACLGDIAAALNADKMEIYNQMLRRYGVYTYIKVRNSAVTRFKNEWRAVDVVADDGKYSELLCYFGSSTYDSKEMSVLLNGVISEMQEIGLELPPPTHIKESLERWQK